MHSSVAGTGTDDDFNGTSLVGYVTTTYAVLEAAFGTPVSGPRWVLRRGTRPDKTSCEWIVRFKDGTVATIYDYGYPKRTTKDRYAWHIGGKNPDACLDAVRAALPSDIIIEDYNAHFQRIKEEWEARKAWALEEMKKAGLSEKQIQKEAKRMRG